MLLIFKAMIEQLLQAIALGMGVSVLAILCTHASITEKPRNWISSKSKFLAGLLDCPFCTSFWITVPVECLFALNIFDPDGDGTTLFAYGGFFFTYLFIIGCAGVFSGLIIRLLSSIEQ
jgi:hypothetical protein